MGARVRETGGGANVGTSNDFNAFLRQQLSNMQQPGQQAGAAMAGGQAALGGQGGLQDLSGAGGALQQFFLGGGNQGGLGQNQLTQFGPSGVSTAPFERAQAASAGLSQAGGTGMANLGQFQTATQARGTGGADLSSFGDAQQANFNTQAPVSSGFNDMLMSMIQQGGAVTPAVAMERGMDFNQAYNTLGQDPLMERNRQRATADLRARFGAEGAGALGTGAQFAESNLNAELAAQDASARRNQAMQLMGQDLAGRQAMAQTALGSRGQDVSNFANLLGATGQARGQDLSTGIQQLGLGAQQSQFNAGQGNALQQAMMQAQLQNQGMMNQQGQFNAGQQNSLQQALMNATLQNQQMGNQQGQFNVGQANQQMQFNTGLQNAMNQFNAGQFNQQGQFNAGQLNNAQSNLMNAMLQNQQLQNQFRLGMVGQGMNMNQMGMQGQQFNLGQLFNSLNQANQLGTAQRNTTVTPNPWMQGLQILGQIAASAAGAGR